MVINLTADVLEVISPVPVSTAVIDKDGRRYLLEPYYSSWVSFFIHRKQTDAT